MKILYFGRYNDIYSNKLLHFLKSYTKNIDIRWSKKKFETFKFSKSKYDYIISFRSYYILKPKEVKKAKIVSINFHPSLPKYRGAGCSNLAIINKDKYFGTTAHIIDPEIDSGKIIDIRKFKLTLNINLEQLINKTKLNQYNQAVEILKKIFKNPKNIENMINKYKKIKWSKKILKQNDLEKIYTLKIKKLNKMSKSDIIRYFRATVIDNFCPKIEN
tara:strand:+ start:3522 stop:4172 length:651 start_codon:yes stop_codon:yes gene_type:complete